MEIDMYVSQLNRPKTLLLRIIPASSLFIFLCSMTSRRTTRRTSTGFHIPITFTRLAYPFFSQNELAPAAAAGW